MQKDHGYGIFHQYFRWYGHVVWG